MISIKELIVKTLFTPPKTISSIPTNEIDKEVINFLQKYIQINTSHPHPQYEKAVKFITQQADKDQLEYQVIKLPSSFPVVVITLHGTDANLQALALNHHIDVVSAPNISSWKSHPFSGHIENNRIYGRGAQDIKGLGAVHYFALKQIKESNISLRRTVHLIMMPDEEVGGNLGAKQFVEMDYLKKLNIGFIIDEAGGSGEEKTLKIKTNERKTLQLRFVCKGKLTHAAQINCHNVANEMISFLSEFTKLQKTQKINLLSAEEGTLLSCNVTSFQTGVFNDGKPAINVVPEIATAIVDIRVPPTMETLHVKTLIEDILSRYSSISYSIEGMTKERKMKYNKDSLLKKTLEKTIIEEGFKVESYTCQGTSDLQFFLEKNVEGVGFAPFTCKGEAHNTDESIDIEQIIFGKKFMQNFIINFCT